MTNPNLILPPPLQDTGPLETMATPLIEAIARALCAAQGCRESENELDRCAFEAQVALTAITEAGYAVVPNDAIAALESAVYVVRNVSGVSEWHRLFGMNNPADFDEDFRLWANHWQEVHESVRAIAAQQDGSISAAQGDGT